LLKRESTLTQALSLNRERGYYYGDGCGMAEVQRRTGNKKFC
jgi:hypothetical protein